MSNKLKTIQIIPYTPEFYESCLEIFQSNMPLFFDKNEESDFAEYLKKETKDYFILLLDGQPIGCGGYFIHQEKQAAGFAWGMIHKQFHKKGYGTALLVYRLRKIQADYPDVAIYLDTSQHTYQFYQRFGFEVKNIIKDGYGDGLDQYDMQLKPEMEV